MNAVTMIGNLATDVDLREVGENRRVASFVLAVDRPGSSGQADFFRVSAWNRQGEVCKQFLQKGKLVAVDGRLKSRTWEDADGNRRSAVEIVADSVEFLSAPERQPATEEACLEPAIA